MQNELETNQQPKIIPLNKFNDYFDYPKVGTLKMLAFRNRNNFKKEVVRYVGRRQYIDIEAFFSWVSKTSATA